jgi:predicted Zn finger-like uncharacterized protein
MILTCPRCNTRYTVVDSALGGAAGRDVRCAKCGTVWHYEPEVAATRAPFSESASAAADNPPEPIGEVPPPNPAPPRHTIEKLRADPSFGLPTPSVHPPPPRSLLEPFPDRNPEMAARPAVARHSRLRIAGLVLTGLVLGLVLIAIWARDPIMRAWPPTVPMYRSVWLADSAGAGLRVTVNPARTPDSLVVNGKITNTAPTAREIPRLRVALRDVNNAEVASQVIDPPRNSLAPGATTGFSTVFKNPDSTATGVAVTFATQ